MGGREGGGKEEGREPRPESRSELASPAFLLSVGLVGSSPLAGTAAAGAWEGPSATACPARRAEAGTQGFRLLGQRHPGERGNFLPAVLGCGLGALLLEGVILPLESPGSPRGLAWTPQARKRGAAATERSEALGRGEEALSDPSVTGFGEGGKSC